MAVEALRTGTPPAAEPAPDPAIMALLDEIMPLEAPIVPIESLAPDLPLVDTFTLIKAEAIEVTVTREVAEPADRPPTPFEASLLSYAELLHELGVGEASLTELVGAGLPAATATADAPASVAAAVSIDDLLYRGRAALLRAAEVRLEMRAQLERGQHVAVLRPLLDELLDLVPLALDGH